MIDISRLLIEAHDQILVLEIVPIFLLDKTSGKPDFFIIAYYFF